MGTVSSLLSLPPNCCILHVFLSLPVDCEPQEEGDSIVLIVRHTVPGTWEVFHKHWLSKSCPRKILYQTPVKNGRDRFQSVLLQWGRETSAPTELNTPETKGERPFPSRGVPKERYQKVFKRGWSVQLGHLDLFIGTYLEEEQISHLFRTGSSFANWMQGAHPSQAATLPQKLGDRRATSLDVCISKRISRRHFRWQEINISQGGSTGIYNCKLF